MTAKIKTKIKIYTIQAIKIMLGSSFAMLIAHLLDLKYASSASIITLLTLLTTKLETLKLSGFRILTYLLSVVFAFIIFSLIPNIYIAYAIYIFFIVFLSELTKLKATISVNAVIGTHFLTEMDFSLSFILNEFCLVVIGISLAIVLNIYNRNTSNEKRLIHNMRYVENKLHDIFAELVDLLNNHKTHTDAFQNTFLLENHLEHFIELACEYNNNTFEKEGDYFEHYFEMRLIQCKVLHSLQRDMLRLSKTHTHAKIVASFIIDMKNNLTELNDPSKQIGELQTAFNDIIGGLLPKTSEEFKGRANLYHILLSLEEFLLHKKEFIESIATQDKYILSRERKVKKITTKTIINK